jgi:hypothetical protein
MKKETMLVSLRFRDLLGCSDVLLCSNYSDTYSQHGSYVSIQISSRVPSESNSARPPPAPVSMSLYDVIYSPTIRFILIRIGRLPTSMSIHLFEMHRRVFFSFDFHSVVVSSQSIGRKFLDESTQHNNEAVGICTIDSRRRIQSRVDSNNVPFSFITRGASP